MEWTFHQDTCGALHDCLRAGLSCSPDCHLVLTTLSQVTAYFPAAVLWDMDGTLVDTEPHWRAAQEAMLHARGLPPLTPEQELELVGADLKKAGRWFAETFDITDAPESLIAEVAGFVHAEARRGLPWRPGARELLDAVRTAGIPCALVTNSLPELVSALVADHGGDPFATVVTARDVSAGKPSPEPYLLAAERLGVDIRDCVVIEDSRYGVTSALTAGAAVLGVPHGAPLEPRECVTLRSTLEGVTVAELSRILTAAHETAAASKEPMTTPATPSETAPASLPFRGEFRVGERVQLTGPKQRLATVHLETGKFWHSHRGALAHDDIIGKPDGSVVEASDGTPYLCLRPLLNDVVMSMPRGAAIIYPKDAAQILAKADIRPGAVVVEAGLGSGGLSMWLLRALAGSGRLVSFERREEFADVAIGNVESVTGPGNENWDVVIGDLQEALPQAVQPGEADRVLLDMLAPWECLDVVADALAPGGVLCCYVATVTQLSRVAEAIRATGCFTEPQCDETLVRGWHVEGLAVRPDHRMVAHTAFLLTARRLAPGAVLPPLKRRSSKSEYSDEDVELWTPGALGEREASDKILRKRARQAQRGAKLVLGEMPLDEEDVDREEEAQA